MSENQNKRLKSIAIAVAILMGIVAVVFGVSKFVVTQNDSKSLNFGEYRVQETEVKFAPKDTTIAENEYTGGEVIVTISPSVLAQANNGKAENQKMKVQYQITELDDKTGVVESKWVDYTGPFSVDHNVTINTRLVSESDENFVGPVTSKDVTQIAVAKITSGTGSTAKTIYYKTLEEAINACPENTSSSAKKIEMVAKTKENVTIPQNKNIILDIAGFNVISDTTNPTITVAGKFNLINSKNGDDAEAVSSVNDAAIKITTTGEFTLGTNESGSSDSNVSTTNPVISGKTHGIEIEENGKFNFYDGKIIAPADEDETKFGTKAINGANPEKEDSTTGNKDVTKTPENYIVNIEKDKNGNEVATLVRTYVVTFDADGGETTFANKLVIGNKEYGELPVATKEGYQFVKWTNGDQTIEATTIVTTLKDHTLKANYTANTYKISYNSNTASGKLADTTATYDKEVQLPTNSKITLALVKKGYTFINWNTQPDGKGTAYKPGATVKNLT